MKTSENIAEISKAMAIAQGEMKPASKSTVNPFFKSKYSTLAQVWEVIREPMTKNNLSVFQNVSSTDHGIAISTRICHSSGQWVEFGPLEIPLNKRDAQSVGSATSYGKRYSLSAAIGVVSEEEDDDAEKAMDRNDKKQPKNINETQWSELCSLIDKCDEKFQETTWGYLQSKEIFSHEKMSLELFSRIKKGCLENIQNKEKIHAIN